MKRFVHGLVFVAGWLSFGLGAIGVVLPILPTTPFMLLSAACFARTSPRFHQWLLQNRVFGPLIKNWQEEQYITSTSKRRALVIIAITFCSSILVVDPVPLKFMLVCFWATCSFFIARLPTVPLSQRQNSRT